MPAPARWFATAVSCFCLAVSFASAAEWKLEQMVGKDRDGRTVYRSLPMEDRFKNPVLPDVEREFQQRAAAIIAEQAKVKVAAGNTYFENEKRTYGYLMAQVLAGRADAVQELQLEDAQADEWHRETKGIDFFACFTLKHQTRKFFYFGDLLEPAYRQRMFDGAKAWTSQDPMRRHHYAFKQAGEGWGPNVKDSWVDVRSTENLYLMRVTSVYLFAEATGNRDTAAKYKDEIRRYVATVYRIGMGEWDSENYHGHSIGPLCNLYDFARDDEVRLLAKAALDFVFAAGAVKYYRGGFNGPTKRDYNHVQPFGGSAANMLWLHFGDCPLANTHWESDEVHLITSGYRPPPAVVHLARKNFPRPVEIFASKPHYSASTSGDTKTPPEYLETQYIGHSFQMGSLAGGTSENGGDVNGFKILFHSDRRGANALQGVPSPDPEFVGSPQYQQGKVTGPNRVAQYGNLAIWLVHGGQSPWRWVVPQDVKISQSGGVTLLQGDRTWIALRPLGTTTILQDAAATKQISDGEKAKFPGHQVLSAAGQAEQFCGVAIEVGERESHGSFADFQKKVLAAEVDTAKLDAGIVQYKAADGQWLGCHWNGQANDLGVWRNGKRHDWVEHAAALYRVHQAGEPADATAENARTAPISAGWADGTLYIEAGDTAFACTVSPDGKVTFSNDNPAAIRAQLH